MLTANQHREFAESGLVRLAGAIPVRDAELMRKSVWRDLEKRYGIRPDGSETWRVERPSGFQELVRSGAFAPMGSSAVCEALDDLIGQGGWQRPDYWSGVLVTFPGGEGRWNVPHNTWHLDLPAREAGDAVRGVRVFAFLTAVEPGGGGTAAVAGSHRMVQELVARNGAAVKRRSADVRDALVREYPWFKALCSSDGTVDRVQRFMKDGDVIRGGRVRVVEITGGPGDVVLMDLGTLHAAAPNCSAGPRMMLGQQIYRSRAATPDDEK